MATDNSQRLRERYRMEAKKKQASFPGIAKKDKKITKYVNKKNPCLVISLQWTIVGENKEKKI